MGLKEKQTTDGRGEKLLPKRREEEITARIRGEGRGQGNK